MSRSILRRGVSLACNQRRTSLLPSVGAIVVATAYSPQMAAQTTVAPAASGEQLEEVVVLAQRQFRSTSSAASKLELSIIETPQALTVLSSEFMDIANLRDTASAVTYAPGIELVGVGDGTEVLLYARGFSINRERSYRVNSLSVDSEIDLDYFAMDRVEFVRGPASSLYGEADYGATLNRVLKAPSTEFGATATAAVGSYDLRRVEADVQGPLSANGRVSGRAVGVFQDSETFIRGTEDDRWVVAPSLSLDFDSTQLLLQAYYSSVIGSTSDGFYLPYETVAGQRRYWLPDFPVERSYAASFNRIDSSNEFYYAELAHRFSDSLRGAVKGTFSRVEMDNFSTFLSGVDGIGNAQLRGSAEGKTKKNTSFDASLEKTFEAGGREQRLMLSADWRNENWLRPTKIHGPISNVNIFQGEGPYPLVEPYPIYFDNQHTHTKQDFYGASALAYLKPLERWSVLLGMRYSGIRTNIENALATSVQRIKGDDTAWVPRAGLVYSLGAHHNIFLSYSKGIIFNQTALDVDGQPIDPEQGNQYEAGIKGEIASQRVLYSLSVFEIERSDRAAILEARPGADPIYHNVGEQIHRGVEAEMTGELIPGLNLLLSYAYLDVEVKESPFAQQVGNRPPAAPEHSFSGFVTYEILDGPLKSLTFGGGLVVRSEREVDSIGSFALPSYHRVDLRASYNLTDRSLLELNIQNLLDEKILVSQYSSPTLGIAYTSPFNAVVRYSYRW